MRRRVVCGCCTGLAGAVRGRVRLGALQGMACGEMHGWSGYFGSFAARPKFSERGGEMHGLHGSRTGSRASGILAGHGLQGNARLERVFLIFYKINDLCNLLWGASKKCAQKLFPKNPCDPCKCPGHYAGQGLQANGYPS